MATSELSIRRFEVKDQAAVHAIFTQGMKDNYRPLLLYVLRQPRNLVQCVALAVGAGLLLRLQPPVVLFIGVAAAALLLPVYRALNMARVMKYYTDLALKDDLGDIPKHYDPATGSDFWVAEAGGRVVGCVALQRKSEVEAELRRMSVTPGLRGLGVGSKLGQALIARAHEVGYDRVFLTTNSEQKAGLHLYHKLGWETKEVLPYGNIEVHKLELDVASAAVRLSLPPRPVLPVPPVLPARGPGAAGRPMAKP